MEKFEPNKKSQAEIEKERTISDAELLKNGAEYDIDKDGNKVLGITDQQMERAKLEMEGLLGLKEKFIENCLLAMENLESLEHIFISGKSDFEYTSSLVLEKQANGKYLLKNIKTDQNRAEGYYEGVINIKRHDDKQDLKSMLSKYWDSLDADEKKDLANRDEKSLLESR